MKSKHLVIALVVLAAGAIIGLRFFKKEPHSASSYGFQRNQGPVAVETAKPEIRAISDVREFTGTVKAAYTYVVSAKVQGRLVSLNKRIGDPVKANEVIGKVDDTEYRNALSEAQAQVRISKASLSEAQAQLSFTERELERVRELLKKGISSQVEFDALETQLESQKSKYELARAQLEQRDALLSQTQTRLDYTLIRASQPGFIAERHVDGGVLLSVGGPVVTVVGIDTVFVELAVSERDYQRLRPGKAALVKVDAVAEKEFAGTVFRVAPFFQTSSRTAVVEVAVANDSLQLKPGMFAKINVVLDKNDSALVVPSSAIVDKEGKFSVFIVGDSAIVKQVPVEVGINDGSFAQIVSPANISAPVVTLGQHLLKDGGKVRMGSGESGKTSGGWEKKQGRGK